jgi:hypothetical protein
VNLLEKILFFVRYLIKDEEECCSRVRQEEEEVVVHEDLSPEGLAPARAAPHGSPRRRLEVDVVGQIGAAAHVDAAPQLGLLPRRAAPRPAHVAGPREDVDEVQPAEHGQQRVHRQLRPVPRLLLPLALAFTKRHRRRRLLGLANKASPTVVDRGRRGHRTVAVRPPVT